MEKERIDLLLVKKGYCSSRSQAQRSILAGLVFVEKERVDKVGTKVPIDSTLTIKGQDHPYVSRGGLKLEKAFKYFECDVNNQVVLDIGASTGGFTDFLLMQGAKKVYAIDVGYGQLAWKLRTDPRVVVLERTNFRHMKRDALEEGEQANFAVMDVSFISLKHILSPLYPLLGPTGGCVALVKPQFEARRVDIGKKGIVKNPFVHEEVLNRFVELAYSLSYNVNELTFSPIQGGVGNIEFLAYLGKVPAERKCWKTKITEVVAKAHESFGK